MASTIGWAQLHFACFTAEAIRATAHALLGAAYSLPIAFLCFIVSIVARHGTDGLAAVTPTPFAWGTYTSAINAFTMVATVIHAGFDRARFARPTLRAFTRTIFQAMTMIAAHQGASTVCTCCTCPALSAEARTIAAETISTARLAFFVRNGICITGWALLRVAEISCPSISAHTFLIFITLPMSVAVIEANTFITSGSSKAIHAFAHATGSTVATAIAIARTLLDTAVQTFPCIVTAAGTIQALTMLSAIAWALFVITPKAAPRERANTLG